MSTKQKFDEEKKQLTILMRYVNNMSQTEDVVANKNK